MVDTPIPVATYLFGLTLTESVAVYSGIFGMASGAIALFIAWRSHVYSTTRDKVRFNAVVRFDSWQKPVKYNVVEGSVTHIETKCFHIILYNRGPEFRIQRCHIHSRPLLRWPKHFFYKIHRIDSDAEVVEVSNSYAIRGELEYSDSFKKYAKLEVHTKSNESIFVKMEGWKKAKADFEKWKNETAELEAKVEAKLQALD